MSRPLAVQHARVVDVDRAAVSGESTLVVSGGRILSIGPAHSAQLPEGAQTLDAHGAWLLPGLVDAHLHAHARWVRRASVEQGVAAFLDPAACPPSDDDASAPGADPFPEPHRIQAGPPIDVAPGTWPHAAFVSTADEVRAEVRRQAAEGFAFVKLYTGLPPELVRAAIHEAHALGLRAIGDLVATSWTDAADAGIDMLCHAVPLHAELLPAAARDAYTQDLAGRRAHPFYRWSEAADLDGPEIARLIRSLRDNGVVVVPTLVAIEGALLAVDPSWRELLPVEDRLPTPPRPPHSKPQARAPHDFAARAAAGWTRILAFIARLYDGGVTLLAGTDAPRPCVLPGLSLHRELLLLTRAGVPQDRVLRLATTTSAATLRIGGVSCRLDPGEPADFVLLNSDPIASPSALGSIRAVVHGGRVFGGPAL